MFDDDLNSKKSNETTSKSVISDQSTDIYSSNKSQSNMNCTYMNQFLKNSGKTSYNFLATSYQKNYSNINSNSEIVKFDIGESSSSMKIPMKPNYLNPNRKWKYTEYGKELNDHKFINVSKKLAKLDDQVQPSTSTDMNLRKKSFQFKICTYNILAPDLVNKNRDLYKSLDWRLLDWRNRKVKILNEIKRLSADIYCFQEMQQDEFNKFFSPKMNRYGYECYFKKRFGDAKIDGCALCFKKKKFELVKAEMIDFYKPNVEILNRENVGMILLLKPKINNEQNKLLCVATTHILYNPKRGDCKLAQIQLLLAHIDQLAFKGSKLIDNKLVPTYWPVILCGDFNCSNTSKLYEFMTESKLKNYKELNRNDLSGQFHRSASMRQIEFTILPEHIGISDQSQFKEKVDERLKEFSNDFQDLEIYCSFGSSHLRHKFNFKSAYSHYNENNDLEITSIVGDEPKKTVDYIFYHSEIRNEITLEFESQDDYVKNSKKRANNENVKRNELELISTLELFTFNQLEGIYLPNENYPSDHFLLAAKFDLN